MAKNAASELPFGNPERTAYLGECCDRLLQVLRRAPTNKKTYVAYDGPGAMCYSDHEEEEDAPDNPWRPTRPRTGR